MSTDVYEGAGGEHLQRFCEAATEAFHEVAAALGLHGTVEEVDAATWKRGFDVTVRAIALASGLAVPEMRKVGGGAIVNISSVHGFLASSAKAVYDTCKHAVVGLTHGMAVDFGPDNIRVNAISPGFICSEKSDERWRADHERAVFSEAIYPLRRVGRPADIAAAVSFLVSDEAAFITGQDLAVDGGLTIQLQDSVAGRVYEHLEAGDRTRSLRTPPL